MLLIGFSRSLLIGLTSCAIGLFSTGATKASPHQSLNNYIRAVVEDLAAHRSGGGYDIKKAYTRDLDYGHSSKVILATDRQAAPPKPTMCVAATAEVIIEALNAYSKKTNDHSPFQKLPLKSWTQGNINSIRANLFMFKGTGSRGTGFALAKLGIGEEKTFDKLQPYDFVNLNRTHSGHSVTFISYIDKSYNEIASYSDNVSGFKYFSAQGKGRPDAGFAYRYAFFGNFCPEKRPDKPRDCGVIKSLKNLALLDGGTLWVPSEWDTKSATDAIETAVGRSIESEYSGAPRGFLDAKIQELLNRELEPSFADYEVDTTD